MKTLLNLENYGITLTYDKERVSPYEVEYADSASPIFHTEGFPHMDDALNRIVILIMDAKEVYAFEELPYEIRTAYEGIARSDVANRAVRSFVRSVLEGIAYANMRGEEA